MITSIFTRATLASLAHTTDLDGGAGKRTAWWVDARLSAHREYRCGGRGRGGRELGRVYDPVLRAQPGGTRRSPSVPRAGGAADLTCIVHKPRGAGALLTLRTASPSRVSPQLCICGCRAIYPTHSGTREGL